MEQVYDEYTIRELDDDSLRRVSNSAWALEQIELTFLCDQEFMRRRREREDNAEEPADPGDDS